MKIAIVNKQASFLEFFVNLAKYLEYFGHEIVFLSPDKFIKSILVKQTLKYENYSELTLLDSFYNSDSDFINYYKRLFGIKNTEKLVNEMNTEFSAAKNYFKTNTFDYVLIFNGALNVETDVCKQLNLNTFFFEQGYFSDTIQMDRAGVNCNTQFSGLPFNDFMNFSYEESKFLPSSNFKLIKIEANIFQRYFLRFFDKGFSNFIFSYLSRKRKLSKAKNRFRKLPVEEIDFENFGKYIFFPLQVNSDTQIILNSKYDSMYHAIDDSLPILLKTGFKVILKEHPFEVEPVDYSAFVDNKKVFLTKKTDIGKLIENSEFVVNINSSVGFQSLEKYKKVLILGNSFYDNSPLSLKFDKNLDLLHKLNEIKLDKLLTDSYLQNFRKNIFIPGHFYSVTVEMLERIRMRLI